MDLKALRRKYASLIETDLLRFWSRAFDEQNGGIYTCFTNDGSRLVSKDKYVWSQGRMLWVVSRLCEMGRRGLVSVDLPFLEEQAGKTFRFLLEHALLEEKDGVCAYLLGERGEKKESVPGKGFYTSYFVDCFVIMGFFEYGRVFRREDAVEQALLLYGRMMSYLGRGEIRSEPYPVRPGYSPHSKSMILCNVCCVARDALRSFGHARAAEFEQAAQKYMREVVYDFYDPASGLIREMIGPREEGDSALARHFTPGHTNECMWFCMDAAEEDENALERIYGIVGSNLAAGWDREYGGVFRFLDREGGKPRGRRLGDAYEDLIADTWDTKLWWVHAESLYTSLRCFLQTGDPMFREWYEKIEAYVFSRFPNPDHEVGEWIQILDRQGRPLEKVVALPVKDPYHILRDVMLIVELLDRFGGAGRREAEQGTRERGADAWKNPCL